MQRKRLFPCLAVFLITVIWFIPLGILANRIEPVIGGLPFFWFWQVVGIVLTTILLAILHYKLGV